MPSFIEIGSPVPVKKIFEGHIWAWQPSWSYDLDYLCTHLLPHPIDASQNLALIGQVVSEEKMFN